MLGKPQRGYNRSLFEIEIQLLLFKLFSITDILADGFLIQAYGAHKIAL